MMKFLQKSLTIAFLAVFIFILGLSVDFVGAQDTAAGTAASRRPADLPLSRYLKFSRLTSENGLSNDSVWGIAQDSQGFMWFGTLDGLNRYDGNDFKLYRHDPDDPHSLSDNTIRGLIADHTGTLWIGTWSKGLNQFDRSTERFIRYQHNPDDPHSLSNNSIRSVLEDRTDLYSLGVVLYELLTGKPPFMSEDPLEIIHSHIAKRPNPPHECRAEVPEQVSAIIIRLLEKNAEDRYQTALGLRHDLERCFEELNKTGTIKTFKLGELDYTGIFQIPQKLYGRDNEIKTLLDSFDRVSLGQKWLLLVAGYSGVGKSALVHEVQKL